MPADRYRPSPRRWDGVLREPGYPADWEVRRVRLTGEIKWRGGLVYIHCALAGEPVGLAETADGWMVRYGPVTLGVIAHGDNRLRKPKPAGGGLVDNTARCPQGPPLWQPQQARTKRELCHPCRRSDLSPMFPVAHAWGVAPSLELDRPSTSEFTGQCSTGLILDSLDWADGRQFWVCGLSRRGAQPRTGRSETAEQAAAIDDPEVAAAEADDALAGLAFGETDPFADERLADEDERAAPFDLSAGAHPPHLVIGVVPGVFDAVGKRARRGLVALGWRRLPQRLVRADFICNAGGSRRNGPAAPRRRPPAAATSPSSASDACAHGARSPAARPGG